MKENILEVLDLRFDALDLIAINDLLKLNTPEELRVLEETLDELYKDNVVYKTNKGTGLSIWQSLTLHF